MEILPIIAEVVELHGKVFTNLRIRSPQLVLPDLYSDIFGLEVSTTIPKSTVTSSVTSSAESPVKSCHSPDVTNQKTGDPISPISSRDSLNTSGSNETGSQNLVEMNQLVSLVGHGTGSYAGSTENGFTFDHGALAAVANQITQSHFGSDYKINIGSDYASADSGNNRLVMTSLISPY